MNNPGTVLVPMKVDCFIFNEAVCTPTSPESAKISPITQPNYTYLRFEQKYLASDILRHTDLHGTGKSSSNSRFTDLGTNEPIEGRQGVYVHWMVPRPYRAGTASTEESKNELQKNKGQLPVEDDPPQGNANNPAPKSSTANLSSPQFLDVPTRWLVIRHTDLGSVEPQSAVDDKLVPELTGWVIESDHRQSIDKLDESIDLQTDVSPFIAPTASEQKQEADGLKIDLVNISKQAEVFIGSKWPMDSWRETTRERIKVNLAKSSNQLFADFQPHNSNVFSMIDNLTFMEKGQKKNITKADVSYYVLGWHSEDQADIFSISTENPVSRGTRLDALGMLLKSGDSTKITNWRKLETSTRVLCHGTKYSVEWNLLKRPKIPADGFCKALIENSPLAVGTSPLDSILAYIYAHKNDPKGSIKQLADDLEKVEALLIARDEGLESQRRAVSMISNPNFKRQDGGRHVFFAETKSDTSEQATTSTEPSGRQKEPSPEEKKSIAAFNATHVKADGISRLASKLRWDMFALWWNFVIDQGQNQETGTVQNLRGDLRTRLINVGEVHQDTDSQNVSAINAFEKAQRGVLSPFFQPGDPTLLVAGVPSGWPRDYLDKLCVRLDFQSLGDLANSVVPSNWKDFQDKKLPKVMPPALTQAAQTLFEEFAMFRPSVPEPKDQDTKCKPLYHDQEPTALEGTPLWRDRWNSEQPFFPLFLEWEVEYIHIPFKYWKLKDDTIDPNKPSKLRYVVDTEKFLDKKGANGGKEGGKIEGRRRLSGRTLLLPQPGFSLHAKIKAVFSQIPEPVLEKLIKAEDRVFLENELKKLPLLSSPLAGFTDHLITRLQGTHVKPSNRAPTGSAVPIQDAVSAAAEAKFEKLDLKLIEGDSDLTPYGSLVQYYDKDSPAFKPVTHGQFRFTKLNIIDKFGQAIHAIDPDIKAQNKSTYPCTSEYFAAQKLFAPSSTEAATDPKGYEYVQIPPQINQYSRLNASFVNLFKPRSGDLYWKPTTEWENPVWGWVIINYANYGLQFFLADGTFYREVRLGGPNGSLASAAWLPFPPHHITHADAATAQLQKLIDELKNAPYLPAFAGMIDGCMDTLLPAPPSYSENLSSVVGRPLALVNMGWSLELAVEPYTTTVLKGNKNMPRVLADRDSVHRNVDDPAYYQFEVQFGSREKAYDGLVGYFPAKGEPAIGDALDLSQLYTYYPKTTGQPIKVIDKTDRPKLYPFYFDPTNREPANLEVLRCKEQFVFGAVVDPFASVHAYSSILPVKELKLPPWVVQNAFGAMTPFFSIGPLLLQKDVAAGDDAAQLPLQDIVPGTAREKDPTLGVPIPAGALGEWTWLQPYYDEERAGAEKRFYTRLKLDKVDQRTRFEEAPYAAVEGFLHLRKSKA